jgi:hypothetical protein
MMRFTPYVKSVQCCQLYVGYTSVVKNIDLRISTFAKLTDCLVQEGEINSEVMIHDESICKLDGKLLMSIKRTLRNFMPHLLNAKCK